MHITRKKCTTDHNTKQYNTDHTTKHIQYTAFPEMSMVAQLIKMFPRILWNLRFIRVHQNIIQRSPEA